MADEESIPPTTAALLIHEDGTSELWLPKMSEDGDEIVPDNTLLIAALSKFIKDPANVDDIIREFGAEAAAVPDEDGVLAKAPGEYNTWEKRVWRRGFYAGQQDANGEVAQSGSAQGS